MWHQVIGRRCWEAVIADMPVLTCLQNRAKSSRNSAFTAITAPLANQLLFSPNERLGLFVLTFARRIMLAFHAANFGTNRLGLTPM